MEASQRHFDLAAFGRELSEFYDKDGAVLREKNGNEENVIRTTVRFRLRFTTDSEAETGSATEATRRKPRLCCICFWSSDEGVALCLGDCC